MHYIQGKQCKSCTKCNTDKELTEFPKSSATKDGYSDWCKDCKDAGFTIAHSLEEGQEETIRCSHCKARRELSEFKTGTEICNICAEILKERDTPLACPTGPVKTCTKCLKTQPITEFHKSKQLKDGYMNHCKSCRNKYMKEYQSKRKGKIKEETKVTLQDKLGKIKAMEPKLEESKTAKAPENPKKETFMGKDNKYFGILLTVSLKDMKNRIDFIHQLTERVCDSDMQDVEEIIKALAKDETELSKSAADLLKRTALKLMLEGEDAEFNPMYGTAVEYR